MNNMKKLFFREKILLAILLVVVLFCLIFYIKISNPSLNLKREVAIILYGRDKAIASYVGIQDFCLVNRDCLKSSDDCGFCCAYSAVNLYHVKKCPPRTKYFAQCASICETIKKVSCVKNKCNLIYSSKKSY